MDDDSSPDDEPDVQVENTYYQAKGLKEDEPSEALSTFAIVSSTPLGHVIRQAPHLLVM